MISTNMQPIEYKAIFAAFALFYMPCVCIASIYLGVGNETTFNSTDLLFIGEVQDSFCKTEWRCNANSPHDVSNYSLSILPFQMYKEPLTSCCQYCSCDPLVCGVHGNCCPDIMTYLPTKSESATLVKTSCEYLHLREVPLRVFPNISKSYNIYRTCSNEFMQRRGPYNKAVVLKCEEAELFHSIDTKIPVTSKFTYKTYKNRYCAICQGIHEQDLVYWNVSVGCTNTLILPESMLTIVAEILKTEDCNLYYKPPLELKRYISHCSYTTMNSCNVTGLWTKHDPLIEAACHAYATPFSKHYRNIFCFLCNEDKNTRMFCVDKQEPSNLDVAFSALLNFRQAMRQSFDNSMRTWTRGQCSRKQMYDSYMDICRDVRCGSMKSLQNMVCVNLVDGLKGVLLEMFLKLTPSEPLNHTAMEQVVLGIEEHLITMMTVLGISDLIKVFSIYQSKNKENESDTIADTQTYFVAHVVVGGERSMLIDVASIDALVEMHMTSMKVEYKNGLNISVNAELDVYDILVNFDNSTSLYDVMQNNTLDQVLGGKFAQEMEPKNIIILTALNNCPLIFLDNNEFSISIHRLTVHVSELNISWGRNEYIEKRGGILVCMKSYLTAINRTKAQLDDPFDEMPNSTTQMIKATFSAKGALSLACTCLSVLFSLLTLLTYGLFSELRTQPGINNMALLVCLVVAQCLLQFGSGQAINVSTVTCTVIGMLVHLFWLMVILWMNVCSYHIFKVFRSSVVRDRSDPMITVWYWLYCVGVSMTLVIINVIVALSNSRNPEGYAGYGGVICYISNQSMVAYTFAIPVAVVMVMNLLMFLIVIIKLSRNAASSKQLQTSRNYFSIYARLSTLTGLTWVFGFAYFFTHFEALEYVFIILNSGQGVLIFVSFVCNERVFKKYKYFIACKETDTTTKSDTRTSLRSEK